MSETFSIDERIVDGQRILKTAGPLKHQGCKTLASALRRDMVDGVSRVILDIDGLTHMSSDSLDTLASEHRFLADAGCQVVLAGRNPEVRQLLSLSSLDEVIKTVDSVEDALALP